MNKPSRTYRAKHKTKPTRRTKPRPSAPFTKQYPSIRTLLFFYALCFLSYDLSPYAPFNLILAYKATLILDVLSGSRYTNGGLKTSLVGRMWADTCGTCLIAITFYTTTNLAILLILISGLTMVILKHRPQRTRRTA